MTPILALGFTILVSAALWARWVWEDAKAAFDEDPKSHTASEKMKHWRRVRGKRGSVMLATPIVALALIPVYLFLHLILELV
jgi:hypothetical protein